MKRVEPIGEYLMQTGADVIILQEVFHKKAKRTLIKKLQQIYPTWKESDLETLDKVITDKELEELFEAHGIDK